MLDLDLIQRKTDAVLPFVAPDIREVTKPPYAPKDVAKMIDHTALKPAVVPADIRQLCGEAKQFGFASVCVNPVYVPLAKSLLDGSSVKVCTVVGFPLGAMMSELKAKEADAALDAGATEIDMVLPIGLLKAGEYEAVYRDIAAVVEATHAKGGLVKVIIEAVLLEDSEIVAASLLTEMAGAEFVKTSTGFAGGGATIHDVALMRATVSRHILIKAAGGVRSFEDAINVIAAGANRIGASAGVQIVQGQTGESY